MLRTHAAFFALVPALALGWAACAVDADTEEDTQSDSEAIIVLPLPTLEGTYRQERPLKAGQMELLVLKSDGTYHRAITHVCITSPCEPGVEDGKFAIWGEKHNFMTFYPEGGRRMEHFQFHFLGDGIWLRAFDSRVSFTLPKTVERSWCEATPDCTLQRLPQLACRGFWTCREAVQTCGYTCNLPL